MLPILSCKFLDIYILEFPNSYLLGTVSGKTIEFSYGMTFEWCIISKPEDQGILDYLMRVLMTFIDFSSQAVIFKMLLYSETMHLHRCSRFFHKMRYLNFKLLKLQLPHLKCNFISRLRLKLLKYFSLVIIQILAYTKMLADII